MKYTKIDSTTEFCPHGFCKVIIFKNLQKGSARYPSTTSINSITEVTAETVETQIAFDINFINSPKEVNKSFEQSNIFFEKLLLSKLLHLKNQCGEKPEIITGLPYQRKL